MISRPENQQYRHPIERAVLGKLPKALEPVSPGPQSVQHARNVTKHSSRYVL